MAAVPFLVIAASTTKLCTVGSGGAGVPAESIPVLWSISIRVPFEMTNFFPTSSKSDTGRSWMSTSSC